MAIEPMNRKEILYDIRNNMLRELLIAEINVLAFQQQELNIVSGALNPELSKNLTHWRNVVNNINNSLAIVDQMVAEEKKEENKNKKVPESN